MTISFNPNEAISVELRLAGESTSYQQVLEIQDRLGEGGMGKVYTVKRLNVPEGTVNIISAMKIFDGERIEEKGREEFKIRFHREVKLMERFDHPNIARLIGAGTTEHGDSFYLAEHIKGMTLRDFQQNRARKLRLVKRERGKPPRTMTFADAKRKLSAPAIDLRHIKKIMQSILEVLIYLHEQDVIHRDLKLENVMVTFDEDGEIESVKVLDFGISKVIHAGEETHHTETGTLLGSVEYIAPEQIINSKKIDHRADLYSAGLILLALLTGYRFKPDEDGPVQFMVSRSIQGQECSHDPAVYVEVSEAIRRIVIKATQHEPENRYHSAREFLASLRDAFGERVSGEAFMDTYIQTTEPEVGTPTLAIVPVRTSRTSLPELVNAVAAKTRRFGSTLMTWIVACLVLGTVVAAMWFAFSVRTGRVNRETLLAPFREAGVAEQKPAEVVSVPALIPAPTASITRKMNDTQRASYTAGKNLARRGLTEKALTIFQSLEKDGVVDPELMGAMSQAYRRTGNRKKEMEYKTKVTAP